MNKNPDPPPKQIAGNKRWRDSRFNIFCSSGMFEAGRPPAQHACPARARVFTGGKETRADISTYTTKTKRAKMSELRELENYGTLEFANFSTYD